MKENNYPWTMIGRLASGDAVYETADGDRAIEKDHVLLVEPTPEERAEINERFPSPPEPEDHTDDICSCGDVDCSRPFGHPIS